MESIDHLRWYEATKRRISVRQYGDAPNAEERQRLTVLASAMGGEGIRFALFEATPKLYSSIIARNIKNVSYVVAIIGTKDAQLARVGYKGEAFVLECTAMGLGTCWMAGTFNQKEAKALCGLQEGEVLMGISPIGHPLTPFTDIPDADRKRKPLEKIVTAQKGSSLADMEPWQNTALKCARIAPSALNMQPWRFAFAKGHICMVAAGLFSANADVDLGIAMLHIDLGAASAGVRGVWTQDKTVWIYSKLEGEAPQ